MPSKKKKKAPVNDPRRIIASYHGLCSRICDKLHLTPDVSKSDEPKPNLEFKALEDWCNERQQHDLRL